MTRNLPKLARGTSLAYHPDRESAKPGNPAHARCRPDPRDHIRTAAEGRTSVVAGRSTQYQVSVSRLHHRSVRTLSADIIVVGP